MKQVALVVSHVGSGSGAICDALGQNPRLAVFRTGQAYTHPDSLEALTAHPHKDDTAAAIWVDELLYNHSFGYKTLFGMCRFLYIVRESRPSLSEIAQGPVRREDVRYYTFRLRRIYEMARHTPGAVLLTFEDICKGRGSPLIESYLNLKTPLQPVVQPVTAERHIPAEMLREAQESFERYLYLLRRLPLQQCV